MVLEKGDIIWIVKRLGGLKAIPLKVLKKNKESYTLESPKQRKNFTSKFHEKPNFIYLKEPGGYNIWTHKSYNSDYEYEVFSEADAIAKAKKVNLEDFLKSKKSDLADVESEIKQLTEKKEKLIKEISEATK